MKLKARMRALIRLFDVRAYLKVYDPDGKDYGGEVAVRCPVCEREGKLWVLCTDKETKKAGHWICYYCDQGGNDVVSLVRRLEDCSLFDALEILISHQEDGRQATDLHMLIQDTLFGVEGAIEPHWDDTPIVPVPLPVEFRRTKDVTAHRYFAIRGISQEQADRYKLGTCKDGKYAGRLVVPVSLHAQQVFFIARYMRKKPPKGVKKALYPHGAKAGRVLFNYDVAKKYTRVYLVEDVFSAMAIGKHAMATFGTSLSQYQLDLLLRSAAQEIIIMWDRDDGAKPGQSGYEKAQKVATRLAEFYRVRNVRLPDARDPDEIPRKERMQLVKATPVLDESSAWRAAALAHL